MNGKLLLKGPLPDLPVPRPHVDVVARSRSSKPASRWADRSCATRRIVRRRPGEDPAVPAAAGLGLRERPQLQGLRGRPARGREGAVLPDGHPASRRRPARDLGRCRNRLLQPRVQHRPRPEPEHRGRTVDPEHRASRPPWATTCSSTPRSPRSSTPKRSVVVRYRQAGMDNEVEARCVVLTTPATVSHQVAVDLPQDVRDALGTVGLRALRERGVPHERVHSPAVGCRVRDRHAEAVVQHRAQPVQPRPGDLEPGPR